MYVLILRGLQVGLPHFCRFSIKTTIYQKKQKKPFIISFGQLMVLLN